MTKSGINYGEIVNSVTMANGKEYELILLGAQYTKLTSTVTKIYYIKFLGQILKTDINNNPIGNIAVDRLHNYIPNVLTIE